MHQIDPNVNKTRDRNQPMGSAARIVMRAVGLLQISSAWAAIAAPDARTSIDASMPQLEWDDPIIYRCARSLHGEVV